MIHFDNVLLADLPEIARSVLREAQSCPVVLFEGQMGAGKTTLISAILRQLNIQPEGSPTYGLVKTYLGPETEVYHFDAYRIESTQEAFDAGLEELVFSGNLCLIEWPDKIRELLPDNFVFVKISFDDVNNRFVDISVNNSSSASTNQI